MIPISVVEITYDFGLRIERGTEILFSEITPSYYLNEPFFFFTKPTLIFSVTPNAPITKHVKVNSEREMKEKLGISIVISTNYYSRGRKRERENGMDEEKGTQQNGGSKGQARRDKLLV